MTDSIEAFRGSGAAAVPSLQTGGALSTSFAQPALAEAPESEFNLRSVLLILLKWRWLLLAFMMAGLVIATGLTLLSTPLYRASTTVEILISGTRVSGVLFGRTYGPLRIVPAGGGHLPGNNTGYSQTEEYGYREEKIAIQSDQ